jgi:hypothetical protein
MTLVADYVAALGRGIAGVTFFVARALLRIVVLAAWLIVAALIVILAGSHLILAVIAGTAFLFVSGFAWYAYRRVRPRPVYDDAAREGGGMPFVVKVILACIIVVLFLKYFVQIRLVPQSG